MDNSLETQKTEHNLPDYKENNLTIGKYFDGRIDEAKIYSDALFKEEISEHYNLNYDKIVLNETAEGDNWTCKIISNDGEEDGAGKESDILHINPNAWNITFNLTEGEYGNDLTGVMIACDNDWSVTSTDTNPYGPVKFYEGSYRCELQKLIPARYYNKTITFTADRDKLVDAVMSLRKDMTVEEHSMLDWLYRCWKQGDCWNLLNNINQTTTNIWDKFKPTDSSVILSEINTSNTLSPTQNISINYSIRVPPKAGYTDETYLPIRLAFWFIDENDKCYNQDKRTDSNRAEHPYCVPLIAETLGKINKVTNFTVDLRPNLTAGTYNIVRDIEIDPNQIWIQYGQEVIGKVNVLEGNDEPLISLTLGKIRKIKGEDKTIPIEMFSGMEGITGAIVGSGDVFEDAFVILFILVLFLLLVAVLMRRN